MRYYIGRFKRRYHQKPRTGLIHSEHRESYRFSSSQCLRTFEVWETEDIDYHLAQAPQGFLATGRNITNVNLAEKVRDGSSREGEQANPLDISSVLHPEPYIMHWLHTKLGQAWLNQRERRATI